MLTFLFSHISFFHILPHTTACTSDLIICPQCPGGKQCVFQISYGDGSGFTADVFQDVAMIGGISVNQVFGLIVEEHPGPGQDQFQQTGVDGILV